MNPGKPLAAGHVLDGRYRISKALGVGGMGRVYLANDTRLAKRPVAVKEMVIGDGVHEKKAIEDFAREARVLALLSHPGIPSLIDYFVEGGRHYLVMEFVAGGDLQSMLDKLGAGGKLAEAQVLRWAREILEVLAFLHGQKPPIVYRDLKPGNIMIDKNGRAMLIDFGIARFLPPGGRGTQIGSVGYAPPEQYMGKTEPRSDLYSLGATMHHMLTGRDPQLEPPFSFPPLRNLNPTVSIQTAETVMRALEKDINKRPATAQEMLAALPDPGPAAKAAWNHAAAAPEPPIATVKTAVLSRPVASAPSAAPSGSRPAHSPVSSTVRTIVLDHPAAASAPTPPSASRKAYDLKEKALTILGRGLKAGLGVIAPSPAEPSAQVPVSSRAKTAELTSPVAAPRQSPAAPPRSGRPPASGRQAQGRVAAVAPARLILRADGTEFGISGARAVVGRSADSADALDIDLASIRQGAERVSGRHAEIIRRGPDYYIRDLGSLNGTYIIGRGRLGRDQLYKLKDRDQIVFGSAILQFRKG